MTQPASAFEVLPRDLSAYRQGNTGIDYVHRFDSGKPGPQVLINALTHGNEFCGMVAATDLLDRGVRPVRGVLTVSFANVDAYQRFDPARPFESRQVVHNFNRIWSADWLEGDQDSPELRRAREMRPVVLAADHILDLHSTSQDVQPFWVYPNFARNGQAAMAIGEPSVHLLMPNGLGSGAPIIEYGRHGDAQALGVSAMVAECGQHFRQSSADLAIRVTRAFLRFHGLIEASADPALGTPAAPQRRFELLHTRVVKTPDFRFTRPVVGFETFARDELIALDGDEEIRSPCDECTILMPTRQPIVGREGVYLSRPVA